jgi:hypothetical protein
MQRTFFPVEVQDLALMLLFSSIFYKSKFINQKLQGIQAQSTQAVQVATAVQEMAASVAEVFQNHARIQLRGGAIGQGMSGVIQSRPGLTTVGRPFPVGRQPRRYGTPQPPAAIAPETSGVQNQRPGRVAQLRAGPPAVKS